MDHYLDLTLQPNPEIAPPHLMGALFSKLHRALVAHQSEHIGISFPETQENRVWLGSCLRLHGNQVELTALMATPWLMGMRDDVHASAVKKVLASSVFRVVSRVQAKSGVERLRRRQMRRHFLSEIQAQAQIPDTAAKQLDLPYVQLQSHSTGQAFRLFIRHGPILTVASPGVFSAYGLSSAATIPWF